MLMRCTHLPHKEYVVLMRGNNLPHIEYVVLFAADFIFVEDEVAVSTIEVPQPLSVHWDQLTILYPPYLRVWKREPIWNLILVSRQSALFQVRISISPPQACWWSNGPNLCFTGSIINHLLLCSQVRSGMHGCGIKFDLFHLGCSVQ